MRKEEADVPYCVGHDFNLEKRLCAIVGVEPERTKRITITLAPGEVVMQVTTTYVEETQLRELVRVFEGLVWREKGSGDSLVWLEPSSEGEA